MITLTTPVAFNGKSYTSLTLRRAKVKDLEAAEMARKEGGDFSSMVALVASLADVPVGVVREMDADDLTKLSDELPGFLPSSTAPATTGDA
jgi:hypothetical protein